MPPPKDTNANRLKTYKGEEEEKAPFVMKRFQNAEAKIQTRF
jgi:hypothetical protein